MTTAFRRLFLVLASAGLMASGKAEYDDIRIYDTAEPGFTTVLANGDPVDQGVARAVTEVATAVDGAGVVYCAYTQSDGANNHIYLTRIRGNVAEIWDQGTANWTTTFANGDPIDSTTTGRVASNPAVVVDKDNNVYIAYLQDDATGNDHVHLTRYVDSSSQIQIWNGDAAAWSTTLTDADDDNDGIDVAVTGRVASGTPALGTDSSGDVYVAYIQSDGANNHVHLSRYDASAGAVQIWDEGTSAFTTTMANGDPIDSTTTGRVASNVAMAVSAHSDTVDDVYVTYLQQDATGGTHVMLTRWDSSATDIQIWNDGGGAWSTTLTDADDDLDGIDLNTSNVDSSGLPAIAVNSIGDVFVAYAQEISNGNPNHIRLSMYDSSATDVLIWDEGTSAFTSTLTNGDPIDSTTTARTATSPALVISNFTDTSDDVYVTYRQNDATGNSHVVLTRFDNSAGDVQIWNDDAGAWSTTLTDADDDNDGIDVHTTARAATGTPTLSHADDGKVFVSYTQSDGANNHIYLSAYFPSQTDVLIWDEAGTDFTSTLTLGDPIDQTTTARVASSPVLQVSRQLPTVAYIQSNGAENHVYVSQLGQLINSVVLKSSDDSTCLVDRTGRTQSWVWWLAAGLVGLVLVAGRRVRIRN